MPAKYDFRKNPARGNGEEEEVYHPRIVSKGTITSRRIFEEIERASSFTVGDMEGILTELTEKISDYLIEGYHVELGKIGYFSATLKSRPVKNKKEIRAQSISFDNVNFRTSKWFRKRTQGVLESAGAYGFKTSSQMDENTRKKKLMEHLEKNGYITRTEYSSLTGRLKNRALKDLKEFEEQGLIERKGRGSTLLFTLANK